jgi:hypothetical protein
LEYNIQSASDRINLLMSRFEAFHSGAFLYPLIDDSILQPSLHVGILSQPLDNELHQIIKLDIHQFIRRFLTFRRKR